MYDYLVFDPHKGREGFEAAPSYAPQIVIEYQILRKQYIDLNSHKDSLDELRRQSPDFRSKPTKLIDKARYCLQSAVDDIESKLIYLEPHVLRACKGHIGCVERHSEYADISLNAYFVTEEQEVDRSIAQWSEIAEKREAN